MQFYLPILIVLLTAIGILFFFLLNIETTDPPFLLPLLTSIENKSNEMLLKWEASWFRRHGVGFAALGSEDGCRLTRGRYRLEKYSNFCKYKNKKELRVVRWTPGPEYGGEGKWREGNPRAYHVFDKRLQHWIETVKLSLDLNQTQYPSGFAPDNAFFFSSINLSDAWASGQDECGLPGFRANTVTNNFLLPEADVVLVDYPFRSPDWYPPRSEGLSMILFFSGESAQYYSNVVDGEFRDRFDFTVGLPRGFFGIPGSNTYGVTSELLAGTVSQQLDQINLGKGWLKGPLLVMAVSHCNVGTIRGDYFRDLMALVHVDSYGGCLNNILINEDQVSRAAIAPTYSCFGCNWQYRKEKLEIFKSYPFALAFENTNCYDNVTEKIYDALLAGAIPIYLGAPNVEEWVPEGSYIDARHFSGPAELVAYLFELTENPERFAKYHAWRNQSIYGDAFRIMRMTYNGTFGLSQCEIYKRGLEMCDASQI